MFLAPLASPSSADGSANSSDTSLRPARFVLEISWYGSSNEGLFCTLKVSSAFANSALPQFHPRSECSRLSRLALYQVLNSLARRSWSSCWKPWRWMTRELRSRIFSS